MGYAHRKHICPFQGHFAYRKKTNKCYIKSEKGLKMRQLGLNQSISSLLCKQHGTERRNDENPPNTNKYFSVTLKIAFLQRIIY